MATLGILVRFASAGAGSITGPLGAMVGNLTSVQGAAVAAGLALGGITAVAFKMNSEIEDSVLRFKSLGMSSDEAQAHVKELFEFAKATPFESGPIIEASRQLRVMGGAALDTKDMLTVVGDAAASAGRDINEVAEWTGRAYSAIQGGRPFGEAAQELQRMGLLSGTARNKLEDLQKSGASSEVVFAALRGELEKAQGAMGDLSQTFSGRMSTAIDGMSMALATGLKPAFDAVSEGLGELVAWMETPEFQNGLRDFGNTVRDAIPYLVTWGDLSFQTVLTMKDLVVGVYELGTAFGKLMSGDLTGASEAFNSMTARIGDRAEGWANAVERATTRIGDAQDEATFAAARLAAGFDGSFTAAGDSAEELSARVTAAGGVIGTAVEGMSTNMDAAMKQVADSNDLLTEAMKKAEEIRLADRAAAYEAGQALAEANSTDMLERIAQDGEAEAEIRDKQYEADGKALIKANEDAAKAQEKANNEALALQEKADKEALALQEKADKEVQRVQEQAAEEQQRIAEKNAEVMERFSIELGQVLTQDLKRNLDEGVLSTDYATKQINEMLGTVPESVRDNITVFKDFTISLQDVAPEWQGALTPFMELVNSLPEETRKALGLDIFEWDFWAEAVKNTQSEALTAVQQAQKAIRDALAWKEETNARLGAPAGGRGIGLAGSGNVVGPVPSDSPLRSGAPLAPFNPMARYTQGTTVHGDIIVNARGSAAEEINALSALVR